MANRETFADPRRLVIYGQRTADDRIAFGCRGHYLFGSEIQNRFPSDHPGFQDVLDTLESLLPVLAGARITHRWGGALGIPRNWLPAVGLDRRAGLAWAGGYTCEGVGAANLAGRTLADLILQRESELTTLPLVGPPFRRWEPEPLRWIGVKTVQRCGTSLDAADLEGHRPSRIEGAIYDALVRK